MLAYVVDAFRRGRSEDVHARSRSSIAYDQIQRRRATTPPSSAARAKEHESFVWFVRILRRLGRRYGRIHVRFGEPLSLREDARRARTANAAPDADEQSLALQKLAFEVCVRINRATPITPISLVCMALLGPRRPRAHRRRDARLAAQPGGRTCSAARCPTTRGARPRHGRRRRARCSTRWCENGLLAPLRRGARGRLRRSPRAAPRGGVLPQHGDPLLRERRDRGARAAARRRGRTCADRRAAFWEQRPARCATCSSSSSSSRTATRFREELRAEVALHDPDWEQRLRGGRRRRSPSLLRALAAVPRAPRAAAVPRGVPRRRRRARARDAATPVEDERSSRGCSRSASSTCCSGRIATPGVGVEGAVRERAQARAEPRPRATRRPRPRRAPPRVRRTSCARTSAASTRSRRWCARGRPECTI